MAHRDTEALMLCPTVRVRVRRVINILDLATTKFHRHPGLELKSSENQLILCCTVGGPYMICPCVHAKLFEQLGLDASEGEPPSAIIYIRPVFASARISLHLSIAVIALSQLDEQSPCHLSILGFHRAVYQQLLSP